MDGASGAQGTGCKRKLGRLLQDTLFADLETYGHMAHEQLAITAWYVATEFEDAYDVGMEAAQTLAARFPGDEEKAGNIAWYETLRESERPPLADLACTLQTSLILSGSIFERKHSPSYRL